MSRISFLFIGSIFLFSCAGDEEENIDSVDTDVIFLDYKIWAEEDKPDATVLLQFRFGGPNGETMVLKSPSQVELDGESIKGDSSKVTGAYYEILKPVDQFTGDHVITFRDTRKKEYENEFSFQPFRLRVEIPDTVARANIVFELDGLDEEDLVRVFATDTSFDTPGINRIDTVRNGRIVLTRKDLENLSNGPINLEFYKEQEMHLKNTPAEGGRISIMYGVKREFELKAP